jgi:hypothetical protein
MAHIGACSQCTKVRKLRKMRDSDDYLCQKCREKRVEELRKKTHTTLEESRGMYERARSSWESTLPEFDILHELFSSDCNSFSDIGLRFGVTRERVRQVYHKYFSRIIPRRPDGRTRQLICTRKTRLQDIRESFAQDPRYGGVLSKAREEDLVAEPVPQEKGTSRARHQRHLFKLNGRLCRFLTSGSKPCHTTDTNSYWKFSLTTQQPFDFLILEINTESGPRYLVIPYSLAIRGRRNIYIPHNLTRENTSRWKPKVDWLQYLDAWHLLKDPPAPKAYV